MSKLSVLTIDLGGTSGRGIVYSLEDGTLSAKTIGRFSTLPRSGAGRSQVNFDAILKNTERCISKALGEGFALSSVGVDTWGLDVGLLDDRGQLLCMPVHYDDPLGAAGMEQALKTCSAEELFYRTGSQPNHTKSLFMLLALRAEDPELFGKCRSVMNLSDLLNYRLCGEKCADKTIIGTTQLYSARTRRWDRELMESFGLDRELFGPETDAGRIIGRLDASYGEVPLALTCGHDTACAFLTAGVSARRQEMLVSCGTRALIGTVVPEPVINSEMVRLGLTNETGFDGSTRLLKSCVGMSLFEKLKHELYGNDNSLSFAAIDGILGQAEPFGFLVDIEDDALCTEAGVRAGIRRQLESRGCPVPETPAQYLRCVLESAACCWAHSIAGIRRALGYSAGSFRVVGGGSHSGFLMQLLADLTGMRVLAGPSEASSMGNALAQLYALGELSGVEQMQAIVNDSVSLREYIPGDGGRAAEAMGEYALRIAALDRDQQLSC